MLNTEKLRQLRETKQLKQENLANLLNISQSNYAKIESGKLSIRLDVIEVQNKRIQELETNLQKHNS
jgi:transcriptional regulator with XRE-family HTH domain